MKKTVAIVLGCLLFTGVRPAGAQNEIQVLPPAADAKIYGEYPIAYKETITKWMAERLTDPASAVYEWTSEPKQGEYTPKGQARLVGYLVDFKVNARNQFGAATGKQKYQVLIRNGEVLWGGRPRS